MSAPRIDGGEIVYTPQQAAAMAVGQVEHIEANQHRALRFPVDLPNEYIAPLTPGQMLILQAQTSHGKSSFASFWMRDTAARLTAEGRDEIIIHVSVEETVEESVGRELARESGQNVGDLARGKVADWGGLKAAAIRVGQVPIYRIANRLGGGVNLPELYLSNVRRGIEALLTGKITGAQLKPAAIYLDYLQAFPFDPEIRTAGAIDQRRLQVRRDAYEARRMAEDFDCPVVCLAQCKQTLGGAPSKDFYIPGIYDAEESAAIAQRASRILSLWMPARTHIRGTTVTWDNLRFPVTDDLMWLRVNKQQGNLPAGMVYPLRIDHAAGTYKLHDMLLGASDAAQITAT